MVIVQRDFTSEIQPQWGYGYLGCLCQDPMGLRLPGQFMSRHNGATAPWAVYVETQWEYGSSSSLCRDPMGLRLPGQFMPGHNGATVPRAVYAGTQWGYKITEK